MKNLLKPRRARGKVGWLPPGIRETVNLMLVEGQPYCAIIGLLTALGGIMESIAMTWARQHPNKTAERLNQAPAGPERDRAVSAFAMGVANRYPEQALRWAESNW